MAQHFTGGCQCGAVRYSLIALKDSAICHCRMCQKAVGGPFAVLATAKVEHLTWTQGEPAIFRSSNIATRGFCPKCGTPLTYQGLDKASIEITVGSLDQPAAAPPLRQAGVEACLPWFETLSTLPASVTTAKYDGVVSYQHPDR